MRGRPEGSRKGDGAGNGTADAVHGESFDPADCPGLAASELVRQLALRADAVAVVAARRRNYRPLASLLPPEGELLPDLPEGVCPQDLPLPRLGQARRHPPGGTPEASQRLSSLGRGVIQRSPWRLP